MEPDSRLRSSDRPRFIADEMLGRLAKWLRLTGYDTRYLRDIPDSDLLRIAESEDRIVLTRDTLLVRRKSCRNYIFIRDDHWRGQLRQVVAEAGLDLESALTICSVCNEPLHEAGGESIKSFVPAYVYATQQKFARCGGCYRVYWAATHTEGILREFAGL